MEGKPLCLGGSNDAANLWGNHTSGQARSTKTASSATSSLPQAAAIILAIALQELKL